MQNLIQTVGSQYANGPIMLALINSFNAAVDPSAAIDAFYDNVWNLDTAMGFGLDILGRIVGVDRVLQVASAQYFGFSEANDPTDITGFNQAPFYSSGVTSNYTLTDQAYRQLIRAKALANITDGSIKDINTILLTLFPGRGDCYCTDGENMTMQIVFKFPLQPFEQSILTQSGVIPRPPGVAQTVVVNQ